MTEMTAAQYVYTTKEEVALLARVTNAATGSVLSEGQYEQFIRLAAHEINGIVRSEYVLPLSPETNPISWEIMRAANQIGALFYGYALVQQLGGDALTNPWADTWERTLERLSKGCALPDALTVSSGLVETATDALLMGWVEAAVAAQGQRVTNIAYDSGTRTITISLIDQTGNVQTQTIRLPMDDSGAVDRGEVFAIINEALEPWVIRNNVELPRAAEFAADPMVDYILKVNQDGFMRWEAEAQPHESHFNQIGSTFEFTSSGTTWVDTSLAIPSHGMLRITFENGRAFDLRAEDLRGVSAATAGQATGADDFISLPDALRTKDYYIGRTATYTLLISDRTGGATIPERRTDINLYTVTSSPQSVPGSFDQTSTDARIRALIDPKSFIGNVIRWGYDKLPEALTPAALTTFVNSLIPQHDDVAEAKADLEALRYQEDLGTATITVAASNAGSLIRLASGDDLMTPANEAAGRLVVTVSGQAAFEVSLADLYSRAAVQPTAQLSDSNAFSWTRDGTKYFVARASTGRLLFSQDEIGSTTVAFALSRLDLEDFARRSHPNSQVPASKLQNAAAAGGGGLDQAAVDGRIDAKVKDFAETGNTTKPTPADLAPNPQGGKSLKTNAAGDTLEWGDGGGTPRTDAEIDARIADWAETDNTDAIPAGKLTNAPAGGLDQAAVDARANARVNALVNAIALVGNTARWGLDKMASALVSFYNALNPYVRQIEALGKDVETGGWRTSTGVTVAPLQTTDPTLTQIRALTYSAKLPEQTPAIGGGAQRWVILRTERSVLGGRPDATDLRVVIDEGLMMALSSYAGASADNPVTYDYWKLHLTSEATTNAVPEGAEIFGEWYGPTEFGDNIRVPTAALQGNIPANRITGLPGAGNIELQDGTLGGVALTGYDADVLGVRAKFSPDFSLATHTHGIVDCSLRLNITGASVPAGTVGFEAIPPRTSTAATTEITVSGFVSLNDLVDSDEWVAGGTQEGLKVVEQELYEGSNVVGTLELWLSRDADNHLYRQLIYNAGSTGTTGSVTIGAHLVAFAQVTGGASAAAGGGGGWTAAGSGTVIHNTTNGNRWNDTGINLGTATEQASRMYMIGIKTHSTLTSRLSSAEPIFITGDDVSAWGATTVNSTGLTPGRNERSTYARTLYGSNNRRYLLYFAKTSSGDLLVYYVSNVSSPVTNWRIDFSGWHSPINS